jgi:RNA polymerase sigma-70 factor, ECF subfamily
MSRMSQVEIAQQADERGAVVEALRRGDEAAFGSLAERHRRELQVHCYRMVGSFEESEDLVQETFLRAWRKRETYEGRSSFRAWLYRIATNASLDLIERQRRRVPEPAGQAGGAPAGSSRADVPPPPSEVAWLQPYPDRLLEGLAADDAQPDAAAVSKETIELAFLVAIQHLPPRQRAVLIVRDVLGWSAKETAALLDTSVASVNSALQRARATLRERLPERRAEWTSADPTAEERALLQRYVEATERADAAEFVAMMHEDARFSMPPQPEVYVGRELIVSSWVEGGLGSEDFGHIRCLVTRANMQPAVANYVRGPRDDAYRAFALDVLRVEEGAIAEIVTFDAKTFPAFGLPATL